MTTAVDIAFSPEYIAQIRANAERGILPLPSTVAQLCTLLLIRETALEGKERQVAELLTTIQRQAAIIQELRGTR